MTKHHKWWLVAFDYLFNVHPVIGLGLVVAASVPLINLSLPHGSLWIILTYVAVVFPALVVGWGYNADHGPDRDRSDAEVDRRIQLWIKMMGYASEADFKAAVERDAAEHPEVWKALAANWGKL